MPDIEPFYLFTSISPKLGPEDLEHQRLCIASWRSAGFSVATVNGQSEIEHVCAYGLGIEIIAAGEAGKPSIASVLAGIRAKGGRYAGIINGDCLLLPYPQLPRHLIEGLAGTLAIIERVDVDQDFVPKPDTCSGFDAFLFDTAVLPPEISGDYRIGVPWWDYSFPMAAARRGARIVNVETPLMTHRLHPQSWNEAELLRVGQILWQFLRDWHASDPESFPLVDDAVKQLLPEAVLTKAQLQLVGLACFQWLHGRRTGQPKAFMADEMLPIEIMLRRGRVALNAKADEVEQLKKEIGRQKGEFARLEDIAAQRQRALEDKLAIADFDNGSLKAYLAEKAKHLDAIHSSLSWRLTKPLRSVSRMLRRASNTKA